MVTESYRMETIILLSRCKISDFTFFTPGLLFNFFNLQLDSWKSGDKKGWQMKFCIKFVNVFQRVFLKEQGNN